MITDEERYEVAAKLRELTDGCHNDGVPDSDVLDALGVSSADIPGYSEAYDVDALADLIDRPTCYLELTAVETHGNTKVRIYECSECGRTCEEIYGKYERCPHCGGGGGRWDGTLSSQGSVIARRAVRRRRTRSGSHASWYTPTRWSRSVTSTPSTPYIAQDATSSSASCITSITTHTSRAGQSSRRSHGIARGVGRT